MKKQHKIASSLLALFLLVSACAPALQPAPAEEAQDVDLSGIKSYLLDMAGELKASTAALKAAADGYYALAESEGFDYAALWANQPEAAANMVETAKEAWLAASPQYEQIEGIVAGVPSLADYDVILDAGASAEEDPEGAVPFDLELADGRVFPQPGNLFGVLEATLWGTYADFNAEEVEADMDGDGVIEFGESLPDAHVLKAAADLTDGYVAELNASSEAWEPTLSDAFTALVVMVPTMSEYFGSWKNSRFVAGEETTQRDFGVISRLSDIIDILSSLQVVYGEVKPLVVTVDAAQAEQIETDMAALKDFVADVYAEEQAGKTFTAEEADSLGQEAQDRATAIAGQVAQVAAALNIEIAE
jgi:hypothetical protein